MSRRLPPLNPLRVFETVARTQNLTAAARELHISQSAVSRQVATLESYLGLSLFKRERHGVLLTPAGRQYAAQVVPAFAVIAQATSEVLAQAGADVLRVRTYTTFAAKWLIPRLPDFQRLHPEIEVRLSTAVPLVDFARDAVDVAIQFGGGSWPGMRADLLFHDTIEPVCSPDFQKRHQPPAAPPEALLAQRLLVSHYRRDDWDDWLAHTGLRSSAERMNFPTSVLTWQAALDGLGLAIGQSALLQAEFEAGLLVRPFAHPLTRSQGYYLLRPRHQQAHRAITAFSDWLHLACTR